MKPVYSKPSSPNKEKVWKIDWKDYGKHLTKGVQVIVDPRR